MLNSIYKIEVEHKKSIKKLRYDQYSKIYKIIYKVHEYI